MNSVIYLGDSVARALDGTPDPDTARQLEQLRVDQDRAALEWTLTQFHALGMKDWCGDRERFQAGVDAGFRLLERREV